MQEMVILWLKTVR